MTSIITSNEYAPYYKNYIDKATESNIIIGLEQSNNEGETCIKSIPDSKWDYAYAAGKWTIAEVIQHIIDTERVFAYRALRFARNDKSPLLGFEQDDFVPFSNANVISKSSMLEDYSRTRDCSISLFKSFTIEMLQRIGNASNSPMSTRAVGYILVGHQQHHIEVLKDRYLK